MEVSFAVGSRQNRRQTRLVVHYCWCNKVSSTTSECCQLEFASSHASRSGSSAPAKDHLHTMSYLALFSVFSSLFLSLGRPDTVAQKLGDRSVGGVGNAGGGSEAFLEGTRAFNTPRDRSSSRLLCDCSYRRDGCAHRRTFSWPSTSSLDSI